MTADRLLPESGADDALFRDAESALRWALNARARSPQRDTLASLQKVSAGRALIARADVPGQAGMILAALSELSQLDLSLLVLRLAPRARPCTCKRACCSGWAVEPLWNTCRTIVVDACTEAFPVGSTVHYLLRDSVVRRWTGQKVDIGRSADAAGVHRNTAGNHGKLAAKWLNQHYKQALARAEAAMRHESVMLTA